MVGGARGEQWKRGGEGGRKDDEGGVGGKNEKGTR